MPKTFHNDVFDKGLQELTNAATAGTLNLVLTSQQALTRTDAVTLYTGAANAYRVSSVIPIATSDISIADRAGGGREVSVVAKTGTVAVTKAQGTTAHYALYDSTRLLAVSTATDQALTLNNPLNLQAFKLGFTDPV